MSEDTPAEQALSALYQRLQAVSAALLDDRFDDNRPAGEAGSLAERAAQLLNDLVVTVTDRPSRARVWLLLGALAGCLPLGEEVRATERQLALTPPAESCAWLLDWAWATAGALGSATDLLLLVEDGVVVDVDFTARHDMQTGVQRVVRRLLPRWSRDHVIVLAAWTSEAGALRELTGTEADRVLRWSKPRTVTDDRPRSRTLVLPWRSTVVLPEVPLAAQCLRLASLAEHSENRVVAIGHDCIPVVLADLLPPAEANKFVRYLSLIKHTSVVSAVSESAGAEFRGFVAALPTQGLPGPTVTVCPLAIDVPVRRTGPASAGGRPSVLVVGSHEPRKNHLAVLHAADVLWREGMEFSLRLVGGSGWTTRAFDRRLAVLTRAGRPVTAERSINDDELWAAYEQARFTIFPSLHEGFGLPVAESLALGTPAIGTCYGSIAEIAAGGGVATVDPRDDLALVAVMRELLVDDDALERLRKELRERPKRSWDDYAHEQWHQLVERQ